MHDDSLTVTGHCGVAVKHSPLLAGLATLQQNQPHFEFPQSWHVRQPS
jgi:hypothetical protein